MLALPPVLPDPAFQTSTRLGRDHYVRVLSSDYSVHPRAIGRRVDVRADLDVVRITLAGDLVGQHRRSLVPHQVVTDPGHVIARADLRDARRELPAVDPADVEIRDLAVYDRLVEAVS